MTRKQQRLLEMAEEKLASARDNLGSDSDYEPEIECGEETSRRLVGDAENFVAVIRRFLNPQ